MPVVVNNGLKDLNKKMSSITSIRERFLDEYKSNSDLYDECDADSVRTCNWTIERFILSNNGNEDMAFNGLKKAMKWRKSFGVNHRTDDYFPEDFYKIGGIFQYNFDRDGHMLIYLRVCVHHKVEELSKYIKEFFAHNINKIDQLCGSKQWAIVSDTSNAGLSNVDMDFSRFITNVLQNYFPRGYKYVLIYDMPWIMVQFWKITRTWLSDEVKQMIKFASKDEIFNFIQPEFVPQYISGGKCLRSIYEVPEGVKPAEELTHISFTKEQIIKFRTIFQINQEIKDNGIKNDNIE